MTKYFLRMNVPVSCVRHALYLPVNLANYFMRLVSALLHLPGLLYKSQNFLYLEVSTSSII